MPSPTWLFFLLVDVHVPRADRDEAGPADDEVPHLPLGLRPFEDGALFHVVRAVDLEPEDLLLGRHVDGVAHEDAAADELLLGAPRPARERVQAHLALALDLVERDALL